MTIDDNRGGFFPKTQNQYDVIYVQPLTGGGGGFGGGQA